VKGYACVSHAFAAFCLGCAQATAAWAHESRPAYLEIKESAPDRYEVLWRTPLNAGMRLPIALRFDGDVRNVTEPTVQELPDSLVDRRLLETGGAGLAGKRIDFVGLQATITDVLVRIQMRDGRTSTMRLCLSGRRKRGSKSRPAGQSRQLRHARHPAHLV
jgi:hypothetical protein